MQDILKVNDREFELYIRKEDILKRIWELAEIVNHRYKAGCPVFIPVLNGSFFFASDLIKNISIDCEVSFIKLQSYEGVNSTGKITKLIGFETNIKNRDIIILEDIVDTGRTLKKILDELKKQQPRSVLIISLLFKKEALRENVKPDYFGFEVTNEFLLGYGLDYNQLGRNLEHIYKLR